ncbi:MAG: CopG family transcriptional regulator [Cyanobacterium sp. T60_A2020_053]|nr:CopG family transcriptional regulator [Cyanobacterium sp. T60_A2020_053]
MLTVNLPPNIESRYQVLAMELGKKQDDLLQEAIISYLEDLEDIRDAEYRLSNPQSYLTIDELEESLGLEN